MEITTEVTFELDERMLGRCVANQIDLSELAGELDMDDVADNIDYYRIAENIDVDYDDISERVVESDNFMDHVVSRFCLKSLEENPSYVLFINKIVEDVKSAMSADVEPVVEESNWYIRTGDFVRKHFERFAFKKFDNDYQRVMEEKSDEYRLDK